MSFKQNMLRGLGKCHVEMLESSNREIFREDILYGALNSISYDTYFEGTKCWYIYDLILGMQDSDYFENKIIEKLEKSKKLSIRTFNHLTDLQFLKASYPTFTLFFELSITISRPVHS